MHTIPPSLYPVSHLVHRFEKQAAFAAGGNPLYHALFGQFAGWCAAPGAAERDPLVSWLLTAAAGRDPFAVTLLTAAGLHAAVLRGHAPALAEYYPTAGGRRPVDNQFAAVLRETVLAQAPFLETCLQTWQVQTNETGRGLVWLLPLALLDWPAVDLVDLGASAGLNLLADRRRYDLLAADGTPLARLGAGASPQFTVRCSGELGPLGRLPAGGRLPHIGRRLGCDLAPFPLDSPADELRLMSFVWADQPERLARLREGIAALADLRRQNETLDLAQVRLPEELPRYLDRLPAGGRPLVITNTYITQYFKEEAPHLRRVITSWAEGQPRPVLWLQWEPRDDWLDRSQQAPHFGWCAWTADRWQSGRHTHTLLAWIHPHGHTAQFERGVLSSEF